MATLNGRTCSKLLRNQRDRTENLSHGGRQPSNPGGQDDPDIGPLVPRRRRDSRRAPPRSRSRPARARRSSGGRQRAERQVEAMLGRLLPRRPRYSLLEDRQMASRDPAGPTRRASGARRPPRVPASGSGSCIPASSARRARDRRRTARRAAAPARPTSSVAVRSRSRSSDCRMPYGARTIENAAGPNGSARMSARTSAGRRWTPRARPLQRARACARPGRASAAERSTPTSDTPARRAAARSGRCRSRARAPARPRATPRRRQNGTSRRPSVARSPSRRTARTRPSPSSLRVWASAGLVVDGGGCRQRLVGDGELARQRSGACAAAGRDARGCRQRQDADEDERA